MMKEIGGYFGLERFTDRAMYSSLVAVNSARNALVYLIEARGIKKLYIPYYLCDSVSGVCEREGVDYEYYNINDQLLPVLDCKPRENEYVYVVNYFGQVSGDTVIALKQKYVNIILDNVQAFFTRPIQGIDTVYSCRKFFGVCDGGYVSTDAVLSRELELDVSMDRMKHVLGRFEGPSATAYYGDFRKNDDAFAEIELKRMSLLTSNIMAAVDYDSVCSRRERNFNTLHKALGGQNGIDVKCPEGPYVYPFYCKNGMEIKQRLAKKGIYVATLWPEVIDMGQELEARLAMNILPIPCDQRYDEQDMMRIVEEIKEINSKI